MKPKMLPSVSLPYASQPTVGTGIFGFEDLTRTYRRLVQALA